jgi:hypothetical protein
MELSIDRAGSLNRALGLLKEEAKGAEKAMNKTGELVRIAQQLESMVPLCVELPRELERAYAWECNRAVTGDQDAVALRETRACMAEGFKQSTDLVEEMLNMLDLLERCSGRTAGGRTELLRARGSLHALTARLEEEWPICTEGEAAEALAAAGRGEALDADHAFAQIAGVDRAAWAERVAEHKRRYPRAGQE